MPNIKLIIFDLDNTLVDLSEVHRIAFTEAISELIQLDKEYHQRYLEALPTKEKLQKLNIPRDMWPQIIETKQRKTREEIEHIVGNPVLLELIQTLKVRGFKLYCASNSIGDTVRKTLTKLGIIKYMKYFGSDQVFSPKPSPEMYYRCMLDCRVKIDETLIIEDSVIGEKAINNSGAHKLMVRNAADLTLDKILTKIREIEND